MPEQHTLNCSLKDCWGSTPESRLASEQIWADLEGPQIIIYHFVFLLSVPKTQRTHEWDLKLISGLDLLVQPALFSGGAVPGAPGATRGPRRADNRPKTWGRTCNFILPEVCPEIRRHSLRKPQGFPGSGGSSSGPPEPDLGGLRVQPRGLLRWMQLLYVTQ